jgi:hypothetical protein
MLVTNEDHPAAAVRGVFTFQRKGRNDEWEDVHDLDLSKLRKGESVQLELHSEEVLRLFRGLGPLYEVYDEYGIQFGEKTYVAVGAGYWRALADDPAFRNTVFSDQQLGAIRAFALWVAERPTQAALVLEALDARELAGLDAAAGIARMQRFLREWESNRENGSEDYWHELLTTESWVIGQLLGAPFVIVGDEVFVGGKSFENREGRFADFLYKNKLTGNILIAEIKTPVAPLLGARYRQGVYPPSSELSGAVTQILDQRQTLVAYQHGLGLEKAAALPFNPRTVVLAGDIERQGVVGERLNSFELFRNDLRGVEIVAFDEMAAKAEGLLELFRTAS